MSLARRFMMSSGLLSEPGQVEFNEPGQYYFVVPEGVTRIWGVGIAAGRPGQQSSPFNGGPAGNLHWNSFDVTPGEVLDIRVGTGARIPGTLGTATYLRRGADYLIRAESNSTTLYHLTLGGGGGQGGTRGTGADGNGGLGAGGPGYTGKGGSGGNYQGTANGGPPDPNSGGGRGGDSDGVPYGWDNENGEGTGLLGLSADRSRSLGPKLYGAGTWSNANVGGSGGLRLMWGGGRSYPGNAADVASSTPASLINAASGSGASPQPITIHGNGARQGDIALVLTRLVSDVIVGGDGNWTKVGGVFWKQITDADLDASEAGTLQLQGTGTKYWEALVYRGGVRLELRSQDLTPDAGQFEIPGFTKRIDCKRVILVGTNNNAGTGAIPAPAGFTVRGERAASPRYLMADAAPAEYANDAPVILTDIVSANPQGGWLYELY